MLKQIKNSGILLMLIASLLFSIMGALVKYLFPHIPSQECTFFRAAVGLPMLLPWMIYKKIPFFGNNTAVLFIRSASGYAALSLGFYVTTKIPLADASILNYMSVAFVPLLSATFLGERVSQKLMLLVFGALLGAGFIVKPSLKLVNIPGLLGLASGFFAAIAYVSIKQLHRTESFFTIVFNFMFLTTILSFILFHQEFVRPTGLELLALIAMGVSGTIAQLFLTYAYKKGDASVISPYGLSTVIFSAIWGMMFWNEIPDIWSVVGCGLIIICGISILQMQRIRVEDS